MKRAPVILLVDDDPVVRMISHQSLLLEGYVVLEAEHGKAAMAPVLEQSPDLILLDVIMPEMDGFAFCSWLRAQPLGMHVPVLMMTGLDDEPSIHRAFEVGATDFITKPVNHAILAHRVRFLLRASQNLRDLASSRENLAEAQRIARLGSWEMDVSSRRLSWSDEVFSIFGTNKAHFDVSYEGLLGFVHQDDRQKVEHSLDRARIEGRPQDCIHRLLLADGSAKWVSVRCEPVCDAGGQTVQLKGTVQDITERRQNEETIRYLSRYDTMTSLPNRLMFGENLEHMLAHAKRYRDIVALLHLGIDRFKRVNESFGHLAGDALLVQVAQRLKHALRAEDYIGMGRDDIPQGHEVGRWGGDEFVLALSGIRSAEDAARTAHRLLDDLARPFAIGGQELMLSSTIGIALYPDDGETAADLLKNADAALHYAKDSAAGGYGFYTRAINEQTLHKLSLESALRKALARDELVPYYQPKVDPNGRPTGAELLLRWQHAELGLLAPDKFIDLAEECNLIVPIGEWVIAMAARQLRQWRARGRADLRLAINLSPSHFRHPNLLGVLRAARDEHGLADGSLEIELTEGMLMDDLESTQLLLQALKNLGMSLAIDDFGTGYSSLSYLTRFPIDVLKIDRGFIRGIPDDNNQKNITRAIVALAHSLDLSVVAEGVETPEQAGFLIQEGCDALQGFLYSRPVPIDDFNQWLDARA
jgi:diguanylate cyclase (GGDEF)-like protein/PAS domain S-box-containing protein